MLILLDEARLHTWSSLSDRSTSKFVDSSDVTASAAVSFIHCDSSESGISSDLHFVSAAILQ